MTGGRRGSRVGVRAEKGFKCEGLGLRRVSRVVNSSCNMNTRSRSKMCPRISTLPLLTYTHTHIHTYMRTHIHAYTHTCVHACTRTRVHACVHAYTHACMRTRMRVCVHACVHACMHAYMHTYIRAYLYTCILIYVHACIRTYVHAYIRTRVHAYKHSASDSSKIVKFTSSSFSDTFGTYAQLSIHYTCWDKNG